MQQYLLMYINPCISTVDDVYE